jgi:hypothetical protein
MDKELLSRLKIDKSTYYLCLELNNKEIVSFSRMRALARLSSFLFFNK